MKTLLRILFLGFVVVYFSGCAVMGAMAGGMGDGLTNASRRQATTYNCSTNSYGGGLSTVQCNGW